MNTTRFLYRNVWVFCFLLGMGLYAAPLWATHNLAGQISCQNINSYMYELFLTTYTDPSPAGVDRCTATIEIWQELGGTMVQITSLVNIPRSNGLLMVPPIPTDCTIPNPLNGEPFYGPVKKNYYDTLYTFPGDGLYELRYYDIARREDVINMNDPGSTAFYVSTRLEINASIGFNSSPVMLNHPLEEACLGDLWTHNPGAYDPDGDSLAFALVPSMQYEPPQNIPPGPVNSYHFPDDSLFGQSMMSIDSLTGLVTWDLPPIIGVFNVAYTVSEYRNGQLIGTVLRDMAIVVIDCDNDPPDISIPDERFALVNGGSDLEFELYDPDPGDSLYLRYNTEGIGNNGPFNTASTPVVSGVIIRPDSTDVPFTNLPVSTLNGPGAPDTIRGTISWSPTCMEIGTRFFQLDLNAHDNVSYITSPGGAMLSANSATRMYVTPEGPDNIAVTEVDFGYLRVSWSPVECPQVLGYNIYRRQNASNWQQDPFACEGTPGDGGYVNVGYLAAGGDTVFYSLPPNQVNATVCYVVTAIYPDDQMSCATEEICIENYTTALDEDLLELPVRVYPNPATTHLQIDWGEAIHKPCRLKIQDLQSKIVMVTRLEGMGVERIDMKHLPRGMYVLQIEGLSGAQKFVKE